MWTDFVDIISKEAVSPPSALAVKTTAKSALAVPPTKKRFFGYSETVKPWEKDWNPIQEQLVNYLVHFKINYYTTLYYLTNSCAFQLNYVLDTGRAGAEIIVKEGPMCLTREEFWSLGLLRDMDSNVGGQTLIARKKSCFFNHAL